MAYYSARKSGPSEIQQGLLRVSNFNKSINRHHHTKDNVEMGRSTKYDAFKVNREQAMSLEIRCKNP